MIAFKGIVICVNYDDLLQITLPRNMRHMTECVVVTSHEDKRTINLASDVPSVRTFCTDAFYRQGAKFNKGWAMEEGLDVLGRDGWILIWDADIILPENMNFGELDKETLYGCPRKILKDVKQYVPGMSWLNQVPTQGTERSPVGWESSYDPGYPGYFHLFHTSANALVNTPWYDPKYVHAGGCDAAFSRKFRKKCKLPIEVLHLGPRDTNWMGRVSERIDGDSIPEAEDRKQELEKMFRTKGWRGPQRRGETYKEKLD